MQKSRLVIKMVVFTWLTLSVCAKISVLDAQKKEEYFDFCACPIGGFGAHRSVVKNRFYHGIDIKSHLH